MYRKFVKFDIEDAPVVIAEGQVALFGSKTCHEIIKLNTITRGDRFFEGDKVLDADTGDFLGYIRYQKGFRLQTASGELKEIPEAVHMKVVEGDKASILAVTQGRDWMPISLVYQDQNGRGCIVPLQDIVTKVGECLALTGGSILVECSRFRIPTGYVEPRSQRPICFGDTYAGGTVVLDGNNVGVQVGNTINALQSILCAKKLRRM